MSQSMIPQALKNCQQYTPQTSTPLKLPISFLENMTYLNAGQVKCEPSREENLIKGTRFLSTKAVSLLNQWFQENRDYPYPDECTTDFLAKQAEISAKQVKKWFANKRVRSQMCCKPMNRNKIKSSGNSEDLMNKSKNIIKKENNISCEPNINFLQIDQQQHQTQSQNASHGRYNSNQPTHNQIFSSLIHDQFRNLSENTSHSWFSPQHLHQTNLASVKCSKTNDLIIQNKNQQMLQTRPLAYTNSINSPQFNNALLLKSMSYLNPMVIMNILAAQSGFQNMNKNTETKKSNNYNNSNQLIFDKQTESIDDDVYRNRSSSSSQCSNNSTHNDYENCEENEEKINISVDSYENYEIQLKEEETSEENCNISDQDYSINENLLNKNQKLDGTNQHKIKSEKLDTTGSTIESGSSTSLINSNLSPCSSSSGSSSYVSTSFNQENRYTFPKKSSREKKTNFAVISTLIN